MSRIGHIGPFDAETETFASYEARIKQFFIANGIKNERQVPALISTIGVTGFKTLQDLFAPDDPCSKSLDALFTSLRQHYSPRRLQLAERFRLHKCVQTETQSVTDYIAALRALSLHCGYNAATLEETLRDIFIVGLRSGHIQRELITKPDTLTFNEACTTAKQLEAASKEVSQLTTSRATFVNAVHSHRTAPREAPDSRPQPKADETYRKPCFRCNGEHTPNTCRYKNATCRYCNKRGHIKDNCFKLKRDQAAYDAPDNESTSSDTTTRNEVKQIQHEVPRDFDDWMDDEYIQMVRTDAETGSNQTFNDENMWYTATVNGVAVNFVIDTGSRVTTMPHQSFKQAFPHAPLYPADKRLRTITDEVIHTTGMSHVNVNKAKKRLLLYVTQNGAAPLLGRDWLRALDFDIADLANFNNFPDTLRQTGDATSGASKK